MKVLKFGGSSIGTAQRITKVLNIVVDESESGPVVVVVSAFGGVTDDLILMSELACAADDSYKKILNKQISRHNNIISKIVAKKDQSALKDRVNTIFTALEDHLHGLALIGELSDRSLDHMMSYGEQLSSLIISKALTSKGIACMHVDSRAIIQTDNSFGEALVDMEATKRLVRKKLLRNKDIAVAGGFISSDDQGRTTTLGRSGSDYTASLLGAMLGAEQIEIWTDVDGVLTADPRQVSAAFSLPSLTYREAAELAHFGAKVLHPKTMLPAKREDIPIVIKNTFNPRGTGTTITKKSRNGHLIKGVTAVSSVSLLTVVGGVDQRVTELANRMFGALHSAAVEVLLTTQGSSEQTVTVCVRDKSVVKARQALEKELKLELEAGRIESIKVNSGKSVIAAVGENMRGAPGSAANLFNELGRSNINIVAIAQGSSELNISIVIDGKEEEAALKALHDAFFKERKKSIAMYLVGSGLIGSTLLKQIAAYQKSSENDTQIVLAGISNIPNMVIDEAGIDLSQWKKAQKNGEPNNLKKFIAHIKSSSSQNKMLVDCTASQEVADTYETLLQHKIGVVTPNKKAVTGSDNVFRRLKELSQNELVPYNYETNVGAALPVITTIQNLVRTGDTRIEIEAVLSGTLSYIFNTYSNSDATFSKIVADAKKKGFTEPDPREDLNGMDVARKILILAREIGYKMEIKDVKLASLINKECENAPTVEDFMKKLKKLDPVFDKKRKKAKKSGNVLRYVASLKNGKAKVELIEVDSSHPFYNLSGSDNIVAIMTRRYNDTPLVIKGPGAGAEVTAAGVLADILNTPKEW